MRECLIKMLGYGSAILLVLVGTVIQKPHQISLLCTSLGTLIGLGMMFLEYITIDPDIVRRQLAIDEVYDDPTTALSYLLHQTPPS